MYFNNRKLLLLNKNSKIYFIENFNEKMFIFNNNNNI